MNHFGAPVLFFYRLYRDHDTVYDDGMSAEVCIKYGEVKTSK